MIISDSEVWIDVLLRDHGEIEVVTLHRLIRINSTEELDELRDKRHVREKI